MFGFAPSASTASFCATRAAPLVRRRPRLYAAPRQRRATWKPWCCAGQQRDEGSDSDKSSPAGAGAGAGAVSGEMVNKGPSGSVPGRILVELLALVTGVTLLLLVAVWKALSVVGGYLWRGLMWLAIVRRLGLWFLGRAGAVGRLSVSQPRRLFEMAGAALGSLVSNVRDWTRNGPSAGRADHVNVRAERVVEHAPGVTDEVKHMREELVNLRQAIERANGNGHSGDKDAKDADEEQAAAPPLPPRLILLRHAKSEWDRTGEVTDHQRALSEAGMAEARVIGRELARRGWHFDSVLCSNARRTTETLAHLGHPEAAAAAEPVLSEDLYFALSGEEMATVIDGEAQRGACKLVVAHAPGISELVERLSGVKPDMGTACAALLEYGGKVPEQAEMAAAGEWTLIDVVCPQHLERV